MKGVFWLFTRREDEVILQFFTFLQDGKIIKLHFFY